MPCGAQVVHEPVEEWQRVPSANGSTLNLLDEFYNDPKKYAYTFQNYVFMSRVMQVRLTRPGTALMLCWPHQQDGGRLHLGSICMTHFVAAPKRKDIVSCWA